MSRDMENRRLEKAVAKAKGQPGRDMDKLLQRREKTGSVRQQLELAGVLEESGFRYAPVKIRGEECDRYLHVETGIAFCLVPGGSFSRRLGDGSSGLQEVEIGPFLLGETLCTQRQWDASPFSQDLCVKVDELFPVVGMYWEYAKAWCEAQGFRLPSEAEWEHACRAGSKSEYCFGGGTSRLKYFAW